MLLLLVLCWLCSICCTPFPPVTTPNLLCADLSSQIHPLYTVSPRFPVFWLGSANGRTSSPTSPHPKEVTTSKKKCRLACGTPRKADLERRIWMQVVYFGGDPKHSGREMWKWNREEKKTNKRVYYHTTHPYGQLTLNLLRGDLGNWRICILELSGDLQYVCDIDGWLAGIVYMKA